MKHALILTILAAVVCGGCTKKTDPVAVGEPEPMLAPAGPGRTIEPLATAPEPATPMPATDLTSLAPAEPMTPAPITPARVLPPPPTPTPAVEPAAAGGTYVIKKGDTFIQIARDVYGNASRMHDIMAANPGVNPRKLHVGQVINLPDVTPR